MTPPVPPPLGLIDGSLFFRFSSLPPRFSPLFFFFGYRLAWVLAAYCFSLTLLRNLLWACPRFSFWLAHPPVSCCFSSSRSFVSVFSPRSVVRRRHGPDFFFFFFFFFFPFFHDLGFALVPSLDFFLTPVRRFGFSFFRKDPLVFWAFYLTCRVGPLRFVW